QPIESAYVYVHLKKSMAEIGRNPGTNAAGEALIDTGMPADLLAGGLAVSAGKDNYVTRQSDINDLKPSAEEIRWTIFLERDWADLRVAVDALEQSVMAWNNDVALAGQARALVEKL